MSEKPEVNPVKFIDKLSLPETTREKFQEFISSFQNPEFRQKIVIAVREILSKEITLNLDLSNLFNLLTQNKVSLLDFIKAYLRIRKRGLTKPEYKLLNSTESGGILLDWLCPEEEPENDTFSLKVDNFAEPFESSRDNVRSIDSKRLHLPDDINIDDTAPGGKIWYCTNNSQGKRGMYLGMGYTPFDAFKETLPGSQKETVIKIRSVKPDEEESDDYYIYLVTDDSADIIAGLENGSIIINPNLRWDRSDDTEN